MERKRSFGRLTKSGVIGGILLASVPAVATAQQVTLEANDGSVEMVGDLVGFEDGFYLLRTSLGEMRISASRMSCVGENCPQIDVSGADLRLAGSASIGRGLMPLMVAGYAEHNGGEAESEIGNDPRQQIFNMIADAGFGDPMGSFLVTSDSAEFGMDALLDKSAEVVMSSRRITPDEARALRDAGAGRMIDVTQEHLIAVDALSVIVHQSNPVSEISMSDLRGIFQGQITNWSEIGGPDAPINVYSAEEGSNSHEFFVSSVFGSSGAINAAVTEADSQERMSRLVNEDPNAIGYVGQAFERGAKALDLISSCGIRSTPDAFSAKTQDYLLGSRVYLYNRGDANTDDLLAFLSYAKSDAADRVIARSGFIDLSVKRVAQETAQRRLEAIMGETSDPYELGLMRDLMDELRSWDRLSSTFRYATGASTLDPKGLVDLERLIEYLEEHPTATQVAVVGFTDDEGALDANRVLSEDRAKELLDQITTKAEGRVDHVEFTTKGFGPLAPAACNDTSDGRRINRRVEIWIR